MQEKLIHLRNQKAPKPEKKTHADKEDDETVSDARIITITRLFIRKTDKQKNKTRADE